MADEEAERHEAVLALKELSRQTRRLMERHGNVSLKEIDMGDLGRRLHGIHLNRRDFACGGGERERTD